jgi:hypothetical protein
MNHDGTSSLSWLGWCAERGYEGPEVPAWVKWAPVPDSGTPGPLQDGYRPADRPTRGPPAGADAVPDAQFSEPVIARANRREERS